MAVRVKVIDIQRKACPVAKNVRVKIDLCKVYVTFKCGLSNP